VKSYGSRSQAAINAYQQQDEEASREIHDARLIEESYEQGHDLDQGEYGKAILFSAVDGILTSIAILSAGAGANVHWHVRCFSKPEYHKHIGTNSIIFQDVFFLQFISPFS